MSYAIGLDFGTESGRAVLVDLATGAELATTIHEYANGVIDRRLPRSSRRFRGCCRRPVSTGPK